MSWSCIKVKEYILNPNRQYNEQEQKLFWHKPKSHQTSAIELRIANEVKNNWHDQELKITNILLEGDAGSGKTQLAKALANDFNLPYTKITCFADMDKSDVLGSILPVINNQDQNITYQYYPSEIVKAYENGWLLEIQEPTVINDPAVLMALNSALEIDGSLNLPNRIVKRHPDFVAVITTNRGYNGTRPLNEALRDRIQHAEKMDLPSVAMMVERAKAKTSYDNEKILTLFAQVIVALDQSAKANAIKGVAGMRSYFYWIKAVQNNQDVIESLYHKVIYKITTDQEEIKILEQALIDEDLLTQLKSQSLFQQEENHNETLKIKSEKSQNQNFH